MIEKEDTLEKHTILQSAIAIRYVWSIMRVAEKSEKAGQRTAKALFTTTAGEN